jgi:hypothetical protein
MDSRTHTEQSVEGEASAIDIGKEGVEIKSLVNVREHQLDPRISVSSFRTRRTSEASNSGGEKGLEEPLYVSRLNIFIRQLDEELCHWRI